MKKIKISYFVFMLALASNVSTVSGFSISNQKPEWRQFFQQYVASVGIGTLIGVSTDVITEYCFEKMAPGVKEKTMAQELIVFFIKSSIKSKLLKDVKKDMWRYNIPCKDSLMCWVTYLTPFRSMLRDIYLYAKNNY